MKVITTQSFDEKVKTYIFKKPNFENHACQNFRNNKTLTIVTRLTKLLPDKFWEKSRRFVAILQY